MTRRDSFARKEASQALVKGFKTVVEWDSWGQIEEANKVKEGETLTLGRVAFWFSSRAPLPRQELIGHSLLILLALLFLENRPTGIYVKKF